MGGLGKHFEKIDEKRLENGARIVFEYQYGMHPTFPRSEPPSPWALSEDELFALRKWCSETTERCNERLAHEKTFVFWLNEGRTRIRFESYITKAEASKLAGNLIGGILLDLDVVYCGTYLFGSYFFVSERTLLSALEAYGSDMTPTELILRYLEHRVAGRRAA